MANKGEAVGADQARVARPPEAQTVLESLIQLLEDDPQPQREYALALKHLHYALTELEGLAKLKR